MISEQPSLGEVIQHALDAAWGELHKAGPGIVTAYDSITNTAVVKPAIKHARYSTSTGERTYEALQEIPFVPVIFPRAGGFILRMPLQPGDHVLLVFLDHSLAEWHESGDVSEPEDARRHSAGWPVAIPGLFPSASPPSPVDALFSGAVFGADGGRQVRVGSNAIELAPAGVTPSSYVALASSVDAALSQLASAIRDLASYVTTHTHPTPGGPSSAPTPPPSPGPANPASTASTLVRAV